MGVEGGCLGSPGREQGTKTVPKLTQCWARISCLLHLFHLTADLTWDWLGYITYDNRMGYKKN